VVCFATAALASKRLRASLGGEWSVASLVVTRLAEANKCRAADDLLTCAARHPAFAEARRELAELSTRKLLDIATGSEPLIKRGLALWYAVGTDRRSSRHLLPRRGEPQAVFDHLCEASLPHTIVEVAREGYRKTNEVLCAVIALPSGEQRLATTTFEDDEFPPEEMIGQVPSWALDMYSREGRSALKQFIAADSSMAQWVCAHVPASERASFLGNVLFAVEGGLMRRRLRWPTGDRLREMVDTECHAHCRDGSEVLALMRADIPLLNDVRRRQRGGLCHVG
jgi:hypothetical protein